MDLQKEKSSGLFALENQSTEKDQLVSRLAARISVTVVWHRSAQSSDAASYVYPVVTTRGVQTPKFGADQGRIELSRPEVTSKAYGALKTLCHVKASLPTVTRILLYRTLVLPHLEYCSAIWDPHTAELTSKVERVQNRAMRYILDKPPRTPPDSLRQQLN